MIVFHSTVPKVVGLAAIFLLSACQQVPMLPGLTPHRIDIQQGNVVTQDMVAKLKPGMTRQQVRFALGTPPIVDPFRQDRWDYVYYYKKAGKLAEHRRLILMFDGDILKTIEGDVVAAAPGQAPTGGATGPDRKSEAATAPAETPAEEKGFFGRLLEKIGL
jgi:outer membrane protein assembly factor BamE